MSCRLYDECSGHESVQMLLCGCCSTGRRPIILIQWQEGVLILTGNIIQSILKLFASVNSKEFDPVTGSPCVDFP